MLGMKGVFTFTRLKGVLWTMLSDDCRKATYEQHLLREKDDFGERNYPLVVGRFDR